MYFSVTCQTYRCFQYHNSLSLTFFFYRDKQRFICFKPHNHNQTFTHSKMNLLKSQNKYFVSSSSTKQGYINWEAFVPLKTSFPASREKKIVTFEISTPLLQKDLYQWEVILHNRVEIPLLKA